MHCQTRHSQSFFKKMLKNSKFTGGKKTFQIKIIKIIVENGCAIGKHKESQYNLLRKHLNSECSGKTVKIKECKIDATCCEELMLGSFVLGGRLFRVQLYYFQWNLRNFQWNKEFKRCSVELELRRETMHPDGIRQFRNKLGGKFANSSKKVMQLELLISERFEKVDL